MFGRMLQCRKRFSTDRFFLLMFSVLYKQTTLDAEPSVLLDPNTLSKDGTVAIDSLDFSEDGNLLAYSVSSAGSDWVSIKIRSVESGEDYPELLEQVKFSAQSWTHDNKGFFYAVQTKPVLISVQHSFEW